MPTIRVSKKTKETLEYIKEKEDIKTFDGVLQVLFERLHYMTKILEEKGEKKGKKKERRRESFL